MGVGRVGLRRLFGRLWLTRRGYWMLIVALLAVPGAYLMGRRELLYLGCLLASLPLLSLAFVRLRPVRLSVSRRFSSPVVSAGRPTTVLVEVGNRSRSATSESRWRDVWPWFPGGTRQEVLEPLAPGGPGGTARAATARLRYQLTPPRRGIVRIGPLSVEVVDPFGLAVREVDVGEPQPLVVVPALVPLSDRGNLVAAEEGSARTLQRQAVSGLDDLMAREYRTGDALRRIHWRASAHHGDLMVRQEEQRSHAEARLVIDTLRSGYRDVYPAGEAGTESDAFEWAVRFVASAGLHLRNRGFLVSVVETGLSQVAPVERPREFLESLASLRLLESDAARGGLSFSAPAGGSLGSVFAVLADADSEVVERLAAGRSGFESAVAFLVTPRHAALAEPLLAAGWHCVPVRPRESVETVWDAALPVWGQSHDRH